MSNVKATGTSIRHAGGMILPATTLTQTLLLFLLCAGVVWFAGARLAYLADALADRYQLAKSLVGLLLLALATSLPEVATTLTAAVSGAKELVLNNLFGGIALQTAVLGLADFWARGAITNYPRKANHALEATLLVLLLAITLIITQVGEPVSLWQVGPGSVLIGFAYGGAIWLLRRYDGSTDWVPVDLPDPETPAFLDVHPDRTFSDRVLLAQTALACGAILLFGILLVALAERLAAQTGLGTGFIGVTLLAGATSLPELTTTITAARMGAYTMAISNIFGSNLIMLVLVLPADMLYRGGPILQGASATVSLALSFGIAVTAIYLVGLIVRRKPRIGALGLDSVLVIMVFGASLLTYYHLR